MTPIELPPLPEPTCSDSDSIWHYTSDMMRAYGERCAREAVEREQALDGKRLVFATEGFDGFTWMDEDKYAFLCRAANGEAEVSPMEEQDGIRAWLDAAMATQPPKADPW